MYNFLYVIIIKMLTKTRLINITTVVVMLYVFINVFFLYKKCFMKSLEICVLF